MIPLKYSVFLSCNLRTYLYQRSSGDLYSSRNDPDPEMIPTFLLVDSEIKHGTGDCFFVLCWNATILLFLFILTKFQIKGKDLLGHCLVLVSLQSRQCHSTFDPFSLMRNVSNRVILVLLLCSVLRSVKMGRILSTTRRTNTLKKMSWRKFVPSVPRNLSTFLREFVRMRVEWCNITPATVMFVTFALKRRNGTRTKRSTAFETPFLHLFANWDVFGSGHALLFYFRTLLAICFTLIFLHLRHQ